MIRPQDAHPISEHFLVQGDRLANATRRPVGAREVVTGRESLGMVSTKDAHPISEHLLEQRNRLANATRRPVGAREVVTGRESLGMVSTKNAHPISEHLLEQRNRKIAPALLPVLEGAGVPFGGGIDGGHSSLDSGDGAGGWFISRSRVSRFSRTLVVRGWPGLRTSSHTLSVFSSSARASSTRPTAW